MVADESRLQALRNCCRDEAAFQQLQRLLPPDCLERTRSSDSCPLPSKALNASQAELLARQRELEQQIATYVAQLQAQSQELQQLRQLKQVVLHTLTHELRTSVMGTVMAFKQLLKQPGDCLSLPRSMAEQIVRGGDRHLNLLNSLLDTSTCQEQGLTLCVRPINFGVLMATIAQELRPILQENQATLHTLVSPDLPLVDADTAQIQRAFDHLLCNILKHHPPGLKLTVQATATPDQMLRCDVQTEDFSLNQADCKRLFELQIRTPQSRCSTGLGVKLFLCRQIITAHGGQVGAFSSSERGTTFWFTLPLTASC